MFRHLLVPTNGSFFSDETVRSAVIFAKEAGARITAFHARQTYHNARYGEESQIAPISREQFETYENRETAFRLDSVKRLCEEAGVCCDTLSCLSDHPAEAVISAAQSCGADLIFMERHGRKSLSSLMMGNETGKVLTPLTTPVLIYR